MKLLGLVLVALVALATCDDDITKEDGVLVLTTDNFDGAIEEHQFILVEFYAPWCAHCKALAPEWIVAAATLEEENTGIVLAKVDVSAEKSVASEFEIKGYPTIKFFRKGMSTLEYQGARRADPIINWAKRRSGPSSIEVSTVEEIEQLFKLPAVAVGFFREVDAISQRAFIKASDEVEDVMCVYTNSEELFNRYRITKDNALVVFKTYDNGRDDFDEEFSVVQIRNFINVVSIDLVSEFNQETAVKLFSQDKVKQHIVLFTNFTEETREELRRALIFPAILARFKYIVFMVDTNDEANDRLLGYFNVDKTIKHTLKSIDMESENMARYRPDFDDFTSRGFINFLQALEAGTAKRDMKAQPLPKDWDEEDVKVLTALNFYEVTQDPTKRVFVEFYAPYCGHCKQLEPIWYDVAEHYAEIDPDLIIAKLDGTLNEFADFQIPGFPTLKYYPKGGDRGVVDYDGPREYEAILGFVDRDGNPPPLAEPEEESDPESAKDEL